MAKLAHSQYGGVPEGGDPYWKVAAFTMERAQFWDCKVCRSIVLDREGHEEYHRQQDESEADD